MNTQDPQNSLPQKVFFGRRKGKALRENAQDLFDNFLPAVSLDLTIPFNLQSDILNLEIGFGGGEHLVHQAKLFPDQLFIGVEAFENGLVKALAAIEEANIQNLKIHFGTAEEVLAWLPDHTLNRIDLFYPDPWHKKKHHKRRFVQDERLTEFASKLKPNGTFRFATDIPHYAEWTLQRVLRSTTFTWNAVSKDDFEKPYETWISTRYEQKAFREGRTPAYYSFDLK